MPRENTPRVGARGAQVPAARPAPRSPKRPARADGPTRQPSAEARRQPEPRFLSGFQASDTRRPGVSFSLFLLLASLLPGSGREARGVTEAGEGAGAHEDVRTPGRRPGPGQTPTVLISLVLTPFKPRNKMVVGSTRRLCKPQGFTAAAGEPGSPSPLPCEPSSPFLLPWLPRAPSSVEWDRFLPSGHRAPAKGHSGWKKWL